GGRHPGYARSAGCFGLAREPLLMTSMSLPGDAQLRLRKRWNNRLLIVALLAFAAAYGQFFGTQIRSGFRLLAGGAGDASLIALLHEHVFRSLLGNASLLNPSFYFPTPGVLGYTDTFFLNQVFYAPLRLVGVESLLALELTFMFLALFGG